MTKSYDAPPPAETRMLDRMPFARIEQPWVDERA